MNKDKVSVIIPTYNREKSIVKSIESVLNQTYKNIEVIVVDDASIDKTEKVIQKIKDKRVIYIKLSKNKGAANARNIGIKKATGDYIAFQDSDDLFRSKKIEKQLNNLKEKDADLDFCKILIHDGENELIIPQENHIDSINKNEIAEELCNGNFISTQAIVMKKNIALKYLFDEKLPRYQDYDFLLRLVSSIKISYTNEILVDLYRQKDSISYDEDKLKKAITIMINKKYKLLKHQREKLNNCFLFDYNRTLIEKNNYIDKECQKLEKKYEKLLEDYNLLKESNKVLNDNYLEIINSKRWKIICKILKILKK